MSHFRQPTRYNPTAMNAATAHAGGFSLVEILVAMVVALIGMMIMFQVTENAENRKRTTAAGGDAQIAGSIALYNLERDVRLGGFGFADAGATLGCTMNAVDNAPVAAPRGAFTFLMAPVIITDGAAGAADTLTVLYGDSPTVSQGAVFQQACSTAARTIFATDSTRAGLQMGDLVFLVNGTTAAANCKMVEITDNTTNTDPVAEACDDAATPTDPTPSAIPLATVGHTNTNSYRAAYPRYYDANFAEQVDPALGTNGRSRFNAPALAPTTTTGTMYNLGDKTRARRNVWQIRNDRLVVADDLHFTDALNQNVTPPVAGQDGQNDWIEIGEGIVNLQAQYGLDTNNDGVVDTFQAAAPAQWQQVLSIYVTLLARSQQYERPIQNADGTTTRVTPNAPQYCVPTPGGQCTPTNFTMNNLAVTGNDVDDWRNYRYRVYESTIQLRNMVWGLVP